MLKGVILIKKEKSALFSFKRYKKTEGGVHKKAKHPKLIVDETKAQYGFMGLTESAKRGHHKNIPLKKNPQRKNQNTAYLRDELRYDTKDSFYETLSSYRLSAADKKMILKYLEKKKRK